MFNEIRLCSCFKILLRLKFIEKKEDECSTSLFGYIPYHLKWNENLLVISTSHNEDHVVKIDEKIEIILFGPLMLGFSMKNRALIEGFVMKEEGLTTQPVLLNEHHDTVLISLVRGTTASVYTFLS